MKTQMFPSLNVRRLAASYEGHTIREALFRSREMEPIIVSRAHFRGSSIKVSERCPVFAKEQAGGHSIEPQCSSHAQACAGTSQDRRIPQPGILTIREEAIR